MQVTSNLLCIYFFFSTPSSHPYSYVFSSSDRCVGAITYIAVKYAHLPSFRIYLYAHRLSFFSFFFFPPSPLSSSPLFFLLPFFFLFFFSSFLPCRYIVDFKRNREVRTNLLTTRSDSKVYYFLLRISFYPIIFLLVAMSMAWGRVCSHLPLSPPLPLSLSLSSPFPSPRLLLSNTFLF